MSADGNDGPPLLRPIPRRPFGLNLTSPTPPEEESAPPSPSPPDLANARFLDPRHSGAFDGSAGGGVSLSRAQSIINLTSSTLFGIYSPSVWSSRDRHHRLDGDEPSTPWGTGAQTPSKRLSVDDDVGLELSREGSRLFDRRRQRRRSSQQSVQMPEPHQSALLHTVSLVLRVALLFLLGMGYGVLLTRWRSSSSGKAGLLPSLTMTGWIPDNLSWPTLALSGLCGVALGGLLPWFDGVWEAHVGRVGPAGRESDGQRRKSDAAAGRASDSKSRSEGDWALVIRGVGAFVGIAYAIRRLAWTSTMQVSLTLALANPILWYLIDRSIPGFVLSAAVGLAGSAVVMGLNASIMPAPATLASDPHYHNISSGLGRADTPAVAPPPPTSQQTLELGVWVLSILFCSCLCFGNIGRRLALSRAASTRGRWGGVR